MFTTVAFSESLDPAGVFVNLAAVIDQSIRTAGDFITIGDLNQIVAAYAANGTVAAEAYLTSPSLRQVNNLYIVPVEGAITPSANPPMIYRPRSPVPLTTHENLSALTNCNPAAAEQLAIVVWLADGPIAQVDGEIYTLNAEVTMAQVVNSWEFSEITFVDDLPVGSYEVVGARLVAAGGIAFRFVAPTGNHRPGGICSATVASNNIDHQRYGGMGSWFSFETIKPPGVELLGSAAAGSATYQLYMDVIKVG